MKLQTKNKQRRVLTAAERGKVAGGTLGSGFVRALGTRAWVGASIDGNISSI